MHDAEIAKREEEARKQAALFARQSADIREKQEKGLRRQAAIAALQAASWLNLKFLPRRQNLRYRKARCISLS